MTLESNAKDELLMSVKKMIELLTICNQHQWALALASTLSPVAGSQNLERTILSFYGGMGSLNDVVLYQAGEPNLAMNDEFDALRTKAFDLCCKGI